MNSVMRTSLKRKISRKSLEDCYPFVMLFVALLEVSTFKQDELVGFKPGLINQEFVAQIIFLTIGTG